MKSNIKKILITGATGYLGSNFLKFFIKDGHDVSVLKRKNSNIWRINDYKEKLKFYNIDEEGIEVAFKQNTKYDCVVHTATCYDLQSVSSKEMIETNVLFPVQLAELACKYKVGSFINASSALPENVNRYSLSKKQFEGWGRYFSDSELIKFINIIFEHFYGPNDSNSKFTSYIFNNCMNNSEKIDLTIGTQKRDFVYIDDAVSAFMIIFKSIFKEYNFFKEYEIGSGMAVSIKEFVKMVKQLSGAKTKLNFGAIKSRKNEVEFSKANLQEINKLGWEPTTSLENGIIKSLRGYKK